jgi:single-strand DNA-binding protein
MFAMEAEEEPQVANINRVILTGNLTADPELSTLASGTSVCRLRLAVNRRYKDQSSGEWSEKPNYFDIKVWGAQGENCAQYLSKGRPVAIDGRLEWSEWESQDGGKRSKVEVVADTVQFLGSRSDNEGGGGGGGFRPSAELKPDPVEAFTGAAASDDDIPF